MEPRASIRRSFVLSLVACMTALATAQSSGQEVIERVLATVDGRVITLSDVRMAQALGLVAAGEGAAGLEAARERLVDRVLVLDEVDRFSPPEPDAAAVERGAAAVRARFASAQAFEALLGRLGIDQSVVRQWVRNDLRLQSYIDQRFAGTAEPTREDIENELRQHPEVFTRNGEPLPAAEAERVARERVTRARRAALVREWVDSLRARATIGRNPIDIAPPGRQ